MKAGGSSPCRDKAITGLVATQARMDRWVIKSAIKKEKALSVLARHIAKSWKPDGAVPLEMGA